MGFTLREILGRDTGPQTPTPAPKAAREVLCPTGKQVFDTKATARIALRRSNPRQRTTMYVFRCGYCERYHLGHRRGQIY